MAKRLAAICSVEKTPQGLWLFFNGWLSGFVGHEIVSAGG